MEAEKKMEVEKRNEGGRKTVYFGYGSNLSLSQMKERCPGSIFLGVGRLRGWRWGISGRGYANVVEGQEGGVVESGDGDGGDGGDGVMGGDGGDSGKEGGKGVVYGLLYSLSTNGEDEESLDGYEGVPWAYEKFRMVVEVVSGNEELFRGFGVRKGEGKSKREMEVLVYVDPRGIEERGKARNEYVERMNRGIEEAVEKGLPANYVEGVLGAWIPA